MPQISTTTSSALPGISPAMLTTYRNAFNQGNKIFYADVLNISTVYNALETHYHTVNDVQYLAYGNKNLFPSMSGTATTGLMNPPTSLVPPLAPPQGSLILTALVNSYISQVSAFPASHRHPIVDIFF